MVILDALVQSKRILFSECIYYVFGVIIKICIVYTTKTLSRVLSLLYLKITSKYVKMYYTYTLETSLIYSYVCRQKSPVKLKKEKRTATSKVCREFAFNVIFRNRVFCYCTFEFSLFSDTNNGSSTQRSLILILFFQGYILRP